MEGTLTGPGRPAFRTRQALLELQKLILKSERHLLSFMGFVLAMMLNFQHQQLDSECQLANFALQLLNVGPVLLQCLSKAHQCSGEVGYLPPHCQKALRTANRPSRIVRVSACSDSISARSSSIRS